MGKEDTRTVDLKVHLLSISKDTYFFMGLLSVQKLTR